jgi:hypothetical protein
MSETGHVETKKESYTQKGGQLLKNDPFLSLEPERACPVLRDNTVLGTDVLDRRPEIDCARDHMRFRIPARLNRFDHPQWLNLGSKA